VHLHRNLNQKQYIFALRNAPTTAVKLFGSIALSRIGAGRFSVQTWGSIGTAEKHAPEIDAHDAVVLIRSNVHEVSFVGIVDTGVRHV